MSPPNQHITEMMTMRKLRPPLSHLAAALMGAALASAPLPSALSAQTRPFTAQDMLDLVRISGPVAVSPAGDRIAYVLPDLTDEWNVGERQPTGTVYVQGFLDAHSERAIPLGGPGQRSSFPAFSPDGGRIAFYLHGPEGGQMAVWDAATGEVRVLGAPFSGSAFSVPEWASDTRIVYARPAATEPQPEVPRVQVLRSTDAVLPGDAFFANRRRAGLVVVDVVTGEERALLDDEESLRGFSVAPDGRHVLAAVPRPGTAGIPRGERNETFVWSLEEASPRRRITADGERLAWTPDGRLFWRDQGRLVTLRADAPGPAEGGEARPFTEGGDTRITTPVWSPDGSRLASLVADPSLSDPEIVPREPGMFSIARPFMDLYLVSESGGSATNLTADFEDHVSGPVWSTDGEALFFRATDNATYDETLYRYEVSRGALTVLASGEESYGSMSPVPGGLLVSIQSSTAPADLWYIDAASGARTRVTELNPQITDFDFSEPELLHFDNADGERLGALLYRPTGVGSAPVPVITYVYEKLTPGIYRFSARHQIFATHGYAILMPNVKVTVGETGTSFVKSVVPAVEMVRDMGFTNGRFCLWGGSFGAYATSFVITQTNVFDCAVSRATPPELFRNWASGRDRDSDNIETGQARMGGSPFEVMERYIAQSAFFHLDKVETPVLLTHGIKDYTILVGEGEMMFYALRRLGKEATLVLYREGDHSLYRHSREDALDVHQRMLDWFAKYLRDGVSP